MKSKFLKKVIAGSIAIPTLFTLLPSRASAVWIKNYDGSWSYTEGYSYAVGWRQINGIWYYFDEFGQMRTGWIQSGDAWYYADLSGSMQTGIIQIEGKIYLFSSSGAMQTGNCMINGVYYNFNDNGALSGNSTLMPVKAFDYYGNSTVPYISSQIVDASATMSSDIPSSGTNQVTEYKVKFKDPDADTELLKTCTVDEGTVLTLYEPTKSGYTFVEWNTKSNGDGTSYEDDDTIKVKDNITLYAQWEVESTSDSSSSTDTTEVESITVSSATGLYTITTKNGTLQMTKVISPSDATTQTVTWSVTNGTGDATITSTGKLTAVSDGTVTVVATANDGSGTVGTKDITISGQ